MGRPGAMSMSWLCCVPLGKSLPNHSGSNLMRGYFSPRLFCCQLLSSFNQVVRSPRGRWFLLFCHACLETQFKLKARNCISNRGLSQSQGGKSRIGHSANDTRRTWLVVQASSHQMLPVRLCPGAERGFLGLSGGNRRKQLPMTSWLAGIQAHIREATEGSILSLCALALRCPQYGVSKITPFLAIGPHTD